MASSSAIGNGGNMAHEDPSRPNALYSVHHPSSVIVGDQEAMEVILPFHGSCSRCHHLHTNKPLRYFLNFRNHLRFKCEHCDRDMFGLGNNSTQTTLASQETLSPRSSWQIPPGPTSIPRVFTTDLEPIRLARQSQDLGTIAESISLDGRSVDGAHRSASASLAERITEPGDGDASRPQSVTVIGPSSADGSVANVRSSEDTLGSDNQPQLGIPPRRFRKWKDRITRWIGRWRGTKIEVTFPMHQGYPTLKVSREPTRENTRKTVCQVTQSQPTQAEQTTTMLSTSQTHTSQATSSTPTPTADETHSRDEQQAAGPSDGAAETVEDETSVRAIKRERIKAQRREKTKKSKAMENICQCPEECHCRQPTHDSSIDSRSRRHSISTSDVPSYPLSHIWADMEGDTNSDSTHGHRRSWSPMRHVAFTGAGTWMNPSAARHHHHRSGHSDSWDSQATTAVSNESSISLEGFRPAARRSHSLPPIRQLLHRHGPVIRDALRDDTVHSQFQNLARQARNSDSPPVTQDSTRVNSAIALATETDTNEDGNSSTIPPHASSTSLANLAAPDSNGQLDHGSSRNSSAHRRSPSPEVTHAPEHTVDNMEASPVSLNNGLPNGAPNASPRRRPDALATELDHVSDGASTPSTLRLPSQHGMTSSLTDYVSQPTSGAGDDSTPLS